MTLGDRVLDWLLRRLRQQKPIDTDLVLVFFHESIADTPATFEHGGEAFQFVRVKGELGLRNALLGGHRLVAAIPNDMNVPLDLLNRAYMGRAIEVQAHDVVAGLAGNFCVRIQNGTLAESIMKRSRALARYGTAFTSTGRAVTETEVKQVLVAMELGIDRKLERRSPEELLAQWMVAPPKVPSLPQLATDVLVEAHGRVGEWLAWALCEQKLDALCGAGALAGTDEGRARAPKVPRVETERDWETLQRLVEAAAREAWKASPSGVGERLAMAEGEAHRLRLDTRQAGKHGLLRTVMERALFEVGAAAAAGNPPRKADIDPLGKNLHKQAFGEVMALVEELSRLARFCNEAEALAPKAGGTVEEWAAFARDHGAWADMAARSARRLGEQVTELRDARRRVLERYLGVRDALNARFAETLAKNEEDAYRNTVQLPDALPLHLLTRALIRPLVEDGRRVLLVVLDGCDLSTFYEVLLRRADDGMAIGLLAPNVNEGKLKEKLADCDGLLLGLSPIPTVTSHARRAIFLGDMPKNPILGETESAHANASDDIAAWRKNAALADVPHRLFLKGDLGPDAMNVVDALASSDDKVIAVVLNGVDDALSSHETTAMGPWGLGQIGGGCKNILTMGLRYGFTVVVTADHGHTPYWAADRKVAAKGNQRYFPEAAPSTVAFDARTLHAETVYAMTSVGGFGGVARRGFHGGASLEEVVVPIAMIDTVAMDEGLPREPAWWTGEAAQDERRRAKRSEPRLEQTEVSPSEPVVSAMVPPNVMDALRDQPRQLRALEWLAMKKILSSQQLGKLIDKAPQLTQGMMRGIQSALQRARVPVPFDVDDRQEHEHVYHWKGERR